MAVEFIEEKQNQNYQERVSSSVIPVTAGGAVIGLVKKWGLAKDDQGAKKILGITILVCLIIIVIVWIKGSTSVHSGQTESTPLGQPITQPINQNGQ